MDSKPTLEELLLGTCSCLLVCNSSETEPQITISLKDKTDLNNDVF
jgi:hypothetical protein